jgi:hypothetical protein
MASAGLMFAHTHSGMHHLSSNDQIVDHHHHGVFTIYAGDSNSEAKHQHLTDSTQVVGLLAIASTESPDRDERVILSSSFLIPSDIFLEGPLRPPRSLQ